MSAHSLFSSPRLHNSDHDEERRVSWLELFYDLVYVATLIQLGNAFGENLTPGGALQFLLVFAALWWSWSGFTFYINRFIAEDLGHRALIYLQIIAIAFLGVSVEGAFGALTAQFAAFYVVARLVLVVLYLRSLKQAPQARPLIIRYISSFLIGIALWGASAFLPGYAPLLWSLALVIEVTFLLLPGTRSLQGLLPPDSPHMRERYGIFVIIVLGETFIKTITAASGLAVNAEIVTFGLLAIFVVSALWWLYFGEFEELHLRSVNFAPHIWVYTHLPLTLALTAFGIASKKILLSIDADHIKEAYLFLYCGSLILYLISMALVDWTLEAEHPRFNRLPGYIGLGVLLIAMMFFGTHISALIFVTIVAAAFAVLLSLEIRHSARAGKHL
jgi:low temperature requirement protein LtrA